LDVIDIDGQQVSYPKQLVVETRRIDPTYQGPYEDDVVGILNGTVPLPDYPYVSDWSVAWSVEVAAFPKDVDLSLEFPDQTFYMDQSRAVAMFVGEGARDALAVHPQTHVEPLKRFNWILWGNMALIITILGTLFLRRRLKRVA
ncbi:MAG: hypothetical protein KDA80_08530, partial [Planctomycetaceae bacterium]|nr:hypothetical protein [Planctomycetaceae bacterium]